MITTTGSFAAANLADVKKPIFIIKITDYARTFTNYDTGEVGQYDWLESYDDLSISVSELDGGSEISSWSFTVRDQSNFITADFPGFVFEGKAVTVSTGFVGMAQGDFAVLFTGIVDTIQSANDGLSYQFNCIDNLQALSKVIYTHADDGAATDSKHIRTLNAHPLDILIAALETEVGLAAGAINIAKLTAYRDGVFSGMQFKFELDSAPVAKEFIEAQILKPLGGYLWPNSLGQIDFTFFFKGNPVPGSVMSLTDDNIINVPLAGQSDLINTVTFRMDQDSSGSSSGYATEKTYEYPASISLYGQFGQQVIESAGMRSGLQGIFIGDRVANMIFKRQGLKNLMFQEVNLLWSACVLEPGDITDVTSAHVPDRAAGVMGISGKLFEVFDRKWNFNDGIVTVRLLDATYLSTAGTSLIAENTVPAFLSASTLQKTTYMFLCNDSDTYSNGTAAAKLV